MFLFCKFERREDSRFRLKRAALSFFPQPVPTGKTPVNAIMDQSTLPVNLSNPHAFFQMSCSFFVTRHTGVSRNGQFFTAGICFSAITLVTLLPLLTMHKVIFIYVSYYIFKSWTSCQMMITCLWSPHSDANQDNCVCISVKIYLRTKTYGTIYSRLPPFSSS